MASISSVLNQNQTLELLEKQSLVKSFRQATGEFKALAPTSVVSSTAFVVEPEFSFPLKAGRKYVLEACFLISSAASGGAKIQLNAPANTSGNSVLSGKTVSFGTTTSGESTVSTTTVATVGTTTGASTSTLNATSLYSNADATDEVYVQAFIVPAVDDVLTFSFAQNTSNGTASVLLQGSSVNVIELGQSRRSPNVV